MILDQQQIVSDVKRALNEDIGAEDVTASLLPQDKQVHAVIISREKMLLCGQAWVNATFAEIDPDIHVAWLVEEGAWLNEPTTLCQISGSARSILTAERTALNFLQTLSATSTQTRHYLEHLQGTQTQLLDTRKTIPGLRYAQKYAVACAGGRNHRIGLYDAFLIKENHIKACGSIRAAIELARKKSPDLLLEIEVESLDELKEALICKPDRIMLDNFNLSMLTKAVMMTNNQCELEASGGVDLSTITAIAKTGVHYISVGAITKSIQAIDLSLLIKG